MLSRLDHVVVAVRDLAAATETYRALLGRAPSWRGAHPGAGTANTLFRFDNSYLELLSAEGDGALGRMVSRALEGRGEGMLALAFGSPDLKGLAVALRERGLATGDPQEGEGRDARSGAVRRWRSLWLPPAATRGVFLFAIEHRSPDDALPAAEVICEPGAAVSGLDHVVVSSGDIEASRRLYAEQLGLRLALDRDFAERGLRILFFRVGGLTVEVVASAQDAETAGGGDRLSGIAWRVPDVLAAHRRLAEAGFDVSAHRPGFKPGTRVCTVRRETCGVPTLLIGPDR